MIWICATCAVEAAVASQPPSSYAICEDDRQWVPADGQVWTSVAELANA